MTRYTLLAALMFATPSVAQNAEDGMAGPVETRDGAFLQSVEDMDIRNSDGEKLGEVEEILIDSEGKPAGFLIEIGGFFDLGDADVSVPLNALTYDGESYVSKMTLEQLENLQPFDE